MLRRGVAALCRRVAALAGEVSLGAGRVALDPRVIALRPGFVALLGGLVAPAGSVIAGLTGRVTALPELVAPIAALVALVAGRVAAVADAVSAAAGLVALLAGLIALLGRWRLATLAAARRRLPEAALIVVDRPRTRDGAGFLDLHTRGFHGMIVGRQAAHGPPGASVRVSAEPRTPGVDLPAYSDDAGALDGRTTSAASGSR